MRFGLCITPFTPEPDQRVRGYLNIAQHAAAAGFGSLIAGENPLGYPHWVPAAVPLLARLAPEVPDLKLVTSILQPALHSPVMLAEQLSLLDHIVEAGLVVGVGLGWRQTGFDAMGIPRDQAVMRFEAAIDIMTRLWSGEAVDYDSDFCRLNGARIAVTPRQQPRPPIWIAGNKDVAVRRAARLGDAWILSPHSTLTTLRRQRQMFKEVRADAGLPPVTDVPIRREVFLADSEEAAMAAAKVALGPLYKSLVEWGHDESMPAGSSLKLPFEELVRDRFLVGTPDSVMAELGQYEEDLGVTEVVVRIAFPGMSTDEALRRIDEFGDSVIARMR